MDSKWQFLSLQDAGITLIDCVHKTPSAKDTGCPYVAIPQLKEGRIDFSSARKISADDYIAWTVKARPETYDVIVSRRCNPGESAYVRENVEFALGQNLVLLRSDGTKVHKKILRWLIQTPEWWRQVETYLNVGAIFDSLKCADIPNFQLKIPPFNQQQQIISILGSLDDKIENNRRMNATLEAMAQALFKSWFVDFDPVRAKAEGREPEGMDADTAALFPDRLVDSELGEVPEGWKIKSLDNIACYLNGLALQKYPPESDDEYLPVIKIAQLRKGHTEGADKASRNIKQEYIIQDGDVMFSWSGSLEVLIWTGGEGALNQHLFKVTSSEYPKWFYYFWTLQYLSHFREIAANKATTMGHIQRRHLTEVKAIIPQPELLAVMDTHYAPLIDKVTENSLESRKLAMIRDTLLPKLISGELRVPEAEILAYSAMK